MALEEQLEGTRITRKGDPSSLHRHLKWWLQEDNVLQGQPTKYAFQSLQMHQEGWGSHLGEHTARGTWYLPEAGYTLNYLELRRPFGLKRIPRPLVEQCCCHNYRQHNIGYLYEERGEGDEVRPSVCPTMGKPDLVFQETGDFSPTHSRRLNVIADKLSSLTQSRQNRQNGPSCQSFSKLYASGGTSPKWARFLPPGSTTKCLNLYHWGQIPQYGQ